VLLTHWHSDHTGGVGDLISFDPLLAARIYKNQPDRGQQAIEDGQVFRTEGATVRAIFSPGHAVDHMCFVLEEENALFTGDNILGHGYSIVEDLGAYMKSLRYMEEQRCAVGYPAHGAKIEDLPRKMTQYIQHKEIREKQVYSTLVQNKESPSKNRRGKKSLTTRELVYFLHGEVSDDTFKMALEPFMTQVLWKLAEDGKIGFEMIECNRRWFAHEHIPQVQPLKC
jgi:hydrolase